jgi:type III pantothenate kinase
MAPLRLFAADMGNTSVSFGLFEGKRLVARDRVLTHAFGERDLARRPFFRKRADAALIASVVPERVRVLERALRRALPCPVRVIGRDLGVPIPNCTRFPAEVGVDRLLGALEAHTLFRRACIAVDFGTAITFDVVSAKGEYLGGLIAPGVELTLNALYEKTALLPRIRLRHPQDLVGRSTVESIRAGCSYGLGGLCDGILERLEKRVGKGCPVIATGGYARYVSRYSRRIRRIDEDLVLKGIRTVYARLLAQKDAL